MRVAYLAQMHVLAQQSAMQELHCSEGLENCVCLQA